jgi:hypothetical protein
MINFFYLINVLIFLTPIDNSTIGVERLDKNHMRSNF